MKPVLTIGFPVFDDFHGLYFSAMDILMTHHEILDELEIVVVDNHPLDIPNTHSACTKNWTEAHLAQVCNAHYVPFPGTGGPALTKQKCVDEANGEFVLVMDSHVRVTAGSLRMLIDFYKEHPKTNDLYSGPMFYDRDAVNGATRKDLQVYASHMEEVWRGQNLGTWAADPRAARFYEEPIEIPGMGCGLFTSRKEAFVGFNPNVRGFGGEEFYLHHKTRQHGAKCVCLPFLRWVHRFGRPGGAPFPASLWDKVRNAVINHQELGLPLDDIYQHFCIPRVQDDGSVEAAFFTDAQWRRLLEDPINNITEMRAQYTCVDRGRSLPRQVTFEQLYERARLEHSDLYFHVPMIKKWAEGRRTIVEFGPNRSVSTVALLAGCPQALYCYSVEKDPFFHELTTRCGATELLHFPEDPCKCDIPKCDLLYVAATNGNNLFSILERHTSRVLQTVVLSNTVRYGETGENGLPGLRDGLARWLEHNAEEWKVKYHSEENNGLTMMERRPLCAS